jgi:Mitochondrial K+-H+ exchange-related
MDFYLLQFRKRSPVLYTEGERINPSTYAELRSDYSNPVDRFLDRLEKKESRVAQFLRRLIIVVRDTYYKLEDKIDPMERVFKRLRHAPNLTLFYSQQSSQQRAAGTFEALLARQRRKHTFWVGVDGLMAVVALVLTPILVPIPGPNLFLYYPGLRMISHYLARKGTTRGLELEERNWVALPEIAELEAILNGEPLAAEPGKMVEISGRLRLERLPDFLARYS